MGSSLHPFRGQTICLSAPVLGAETKRMGSLLKQSNAQVQCVQETGEQIKFSVLGKGKLQRSVKCKTPPNTTGREETFFNINYVCVQCTAAKIKVNEVPGGMNTGKESQAMQRWGWERGSVPSSLD